MKSINEILEKLETDVLTEDDETVLFQALAEVNKEYEQSVIDPSVNRNMERIAQTLQEPEK